MNDDELEAFLESAFKDWYTKLGYRFVIKHEYIAIAKHLMEFTDKEMRNE